MKYAVEMGSGAIITILSFIKIGSSIQKLMERGVHRHTHKKRSYQPTFIF
jgi:high-affinity Fe2+/Pb2+ permease